MSLCIIFATKSSSDKTTPSRRRKSTDIVGCSGRMCGGQMKRRWACVAMATRRAAGAPRDVAEIDRLRARALTLPIPCDKENSWGARDDRKRRRAVIKEYSFILGPFLSYFAKSELSVKKLAAAARGRGNWLWFYSVTKTEICARFLSAETISTIDFIAQRVEWSQFTFGHMFGNLT